MNTLIVGLLPQAALSKLIRDEINVVENVDNILNLNDNILNKKYNNLDKVIILPKGFSQTSDKLEQLNQLHKSMEVFLPETELSLLLLDNELHSTLEETKILKLRYVSTELVTEIKLSTLINKCLSDKELNPNYGLEESIVEEIIEDEDILIDMGDEDQNKEDTIKVLETLKRDKAKVIGIYSLYSGAGSSFITFNLAKQLSMDNKRVSVIEISGNNSLVNYKNKENLRDGFKDFLEELPFNKSNVIRESNISWIPVKVENYTDELERFINSSLLEEVVLVDLGDSWKSWDSSKIFDEIFVVGTPSKIKLKGSWNDFKDNFYSSAKLIINNTDSYSLEYIINEVGKDFITVNNLDIELIRKSEWKGVLVSEMPECSQTVKHAMEGLTRFVGLLL